MDMGSSSSSRSTTAKFGYILEKRAVTGDLILRPEGGEHKFTLVWMHGLGDSARGFLSFFQSGDPVVPNQNTKVVLLNAPSQRVTCNGGMAMASWYDILELGRNVRFDELSVQKTTQRILRVLDEEVKELNGDYSKLYIGGFSQGCCMSINVALTTPHTLLDLIKTDTQGTFEEKKKNLRIFAYHGKTDGVIPESPAAKSYQLLKEAGFEKLSYYGEDDLEHSVSPRE